MNGHSWRVGGDHGVASSAQALLILSLSGYIFLSQFFLKLNSYILYLYF